MLAPIVEKQRFRATLAFIIARPEADRIDAAPIGLGLRVQLGVAVDLRGRCLEDFGPHAFGEPQHVDGAVHAGFGGLHGVMLIVNWRGRTGEIVNFVNLDIERERHVVAHQFEARMIA
jgi:hypothetical protein